MVPKSYEHKEYIAPLFQEKDLDYRIHSSNSRSIEELVKTGLLVDEGNLNHTTFYATLEHINYKLNSSNFGFNVMVFGLPIDWKRKEIFEETTIQPDDPDENNDYLMLKNKFLVGCYNKKSKEVIFNKNYVNYNNLELNISKASKIALIKNSVNKRF